jgi:hypothetical protein
LKHRAGKTFWKRYKQLPTHIQRRARKQYLLLKQNPYHPSLHFKPIGNLWSVRVNDTYRALAVINNGRFVWFWIGHHSEYDTILKKS